MSGTVQIRSHNPWDDIYNFADLCRLCGKRDTKMVSIFDSQNKLDLRVMINQHFLDFQVTESDTLPTKICGKCKATLTLWHGFHQKCLTTNKNFLNVLSKMTKTSTVSQSTVASSADETKMTIVHSNETVKNDLLDPSIEVIEVKIADDDVIQTFTVSDSDDDEVVPADVKDLQVPNVETAVDPLAGTTDVEMGIEEIVSEVKNVEKMSDKKSAKSTNTTVQKCTPQMARTVEQPSSSLSWNKTTNNKLALQLSSCRICGKSFNDRNVYLRHLLRSHTNLAAMSKKSAGDANNAASSADTTAKIFKKSATSRLQKKKRVRPPRKQDESDPVMCDLCGKTFVFRSSYHKHVREQHSDNPPPSKPKRARRMCDLCGQICSASSFNGHMKKHTNPELLTCEYCNMVFSFDSVLRSHMKVKHSNERPYKCTQCDAAFKRADYLRSHQRYKHHPKEPRYLRDENGRRFYTCGSCDSRFKSAELLEQHRASNTKNGELQCCSSFHCTECNASYKKRNYLLLHTRYVHGKNQKFSISEASVGPYKCDRCDRRFASVCGRNYHCKSVHGSVYNSKFTETCDHCGLTFRNRVFYAKHRARIRDRPTCWMCWTEYDTDELLKEHVNRDHVDDLPFECNECNGRFMAMRQLNEHVRSKHMKIRPFKCDYCDHAAIRKDSLEIHIRCCHLMIRPFKCDLCERAFAQASDLRKHRITHTRSLVRVKKPIKPKEETVKLETINVASLIELNPENFDDLVVQLLLVSDKGSKIVSLAAENVKKERDEPASASNTNEVDKKAETNSPVPADNRPSKKRHYRRICHLCGKEYFTDSGFRHHLVMHRDPSHTCHLCGRIFHELQNLRKHLATLHSDERPYQCHLCGMNYKRRDVMLEHIKRVHDRIKKNYTTYSSKAEDGKIVTRTFKKWHQCPYCNKMLASKAYLDDHVNGSHTKAKSYKCNECPMTFTRKACFRYHIKRAHVENKKVLEPRGTFLKDCEYCGLEFRVKKYYDIHIAAKHKNQYPCEYCGVIFCDKSLMTNHLEENHADKLFQCSFCAKYYTEQVYLRRHIYLCHTKRVPYECHHCGYTANKKSTLAVHMRRHTGEKPFTCDYCGRCFSQSVDYRKHRVNHFKIKNEMTASSKEPETSSECNVDNLPTAADGHFLKTTGE